MDPALMASPFLTKLVGMIQTFLIVAFLFGTTYSSKDYSHEEYVIFRDIMVMLLLGFGFLMTFLGKYGLGAVGLTMMITVLAIQLNVFVELLARFLYGMAGEEDTTLPLPLTVPSLIDGEFAAATMLISFGAIIGRASPTQLVLMTTFQSFFYAINKVILVLGMIGAEDVGGSITIHMFGAYFGLAVSYMLGPPKSESNASPTVVSDVLALVGTTLLWVYWPSFVGATETGTPMNENVCVVHTVMALLGSSGAAFYLSPKKCHGKLDPVHIANSTLAGGVAVGSSARLAMTPGGALCLGMVAGTISVYGYVYATPALEKSFLQIYDTCGVGNLHGLPSLVGGLGSVVFVLIDSDADFLGYGALSQSLRQVFAVVVTLAIAIASGLFTGHVMTKVSPFEADEYSDAVWWEGDYFEADDKGEEPSKA